VLTFILRYVIVHELLITDIKVNFKFMDPYIVIIPLNKNANWM